ncbi:hypothetical protein [Nannocystis sp. SCPEA4]|uniref:hypothetical protein n=1 Tax=Nannocystis sp. SCPEA4 TaxID=2996787 RepID=UPI00226D8717|nr:hypothetical protein [Nannocystis sp. SCPEA4]MCY1062166.1 hypothetical protein [Nannocystis sp. SCPEA4]
MMEGEVTDAELQAKVAELFAWACQRGTVLLVVLVNRERVYAVQHVACKRLIVADMMIGGQLVVATSDVLARLGDVQVVDLEGRPRRTPGAANSPGPSSPGANAGGPKATAQASRELEDAADIIAHALHEHASALGDIAERLKRRIQDVGLPKEVASPALTTFQNVVRAGLGQTLVAMCPCDVCRLTTQALGPLVDAACVRLERERQARANAKKKGPEA